MSRPKEAIFDWPANEHLTEVQKVVSILHLIYSGGFNISDLLIKVIGTEPAYACWRDGFFRGKGITHILNILWENERANENIDEWFVEKATDFALNTVSNEMDSISREFFMKVKDVTPEYLLEFDIESLIDSMNLISPFTRRLLIAASQTSRSAARNIKKKPDIPCAIIQAQFFKIRSRCSLYFQIAFGFFLYSTGVSRNTIDMLSKCGLSICYESLQPAHSVLSQTMIDRAREAISRTPHLVGWDNIQICTSIHVEQRHLAPPKVQTGTTSIVYPLRNATFPSCNLKPILHNQAKLEIIDFATHVRPTLDQLDKIDSHLALNIIEILFSNVPGFEAYRNRPDFQHTKHRPPPDGHKTQEYVLRTTTIDESSTDGNIEVVRNIYLDQLQLDPHALDNLAVPCINDQSTNARIRSAKTLRADDVSAIHRLDFLQLGIGLFHLQLNLLWAILHVHRGSKLDSGSIAFYISLLDASRLGADHPDYHTLLSFTRHILTGNILQCWLVESKCNSLQEFAASRPSSEQIQKLAQNILNKYASQAGLSNCTQVKGPNLNERSTDSVLKNVILLNRDLLIFYELDNAISSGNFGRVELLLGTLTMMYAGAGSKNYANELLHFIQNLRNVWTPEFANVMRDNMLINPSGRSGHWMGVDLNIEHNNYFQQHYFSSKGLHGTWDHLADLSPVIPIYRPLKKHFMESMTSLYHGTAHSTPDCSTEVLKIISKVRELEIYSINSDRKVTSETIDIIEKGQKTLRERTMKTFAKRYEEMIQCNTVFDVDEDEIPAICISDYAMEDIDREAENMALEENNDEDED